MPSLPKKKLRIALIVSCVIGMASLGVYLFKKRSQTQHAVTTYQVTRSDISHTLQLSGKIVPSSSMVIAPRQSGRIVELMVKEGAQVQPGDLLFTMRLEAEGQTELLQKRAEVKKLEMEVAAQAQRLQEKQPVKELLGADAVLREENDLDKLKLELNVARDRLLVLEQELGLVTEKKSAAKTGAQRGLFYVNSSTKGIVTLIDKRPGDFVLGGISGDAASSDRTVMVVADMSSLVVRTRVLESDLRYVKKDIPVRVRLDAYPDVKYDGHVTHIGGQGRTDSKAGYTYFEVEVSVDQKDERVLPEMNASIELIFENREQVLTLPVAAVAIFPDHALVHVPDENDPKGFREVSVEVGVVNEESVEIISGLNEGDKVLGLDFASLDLGSGESHKGASSKGSGHGPKLKAPRSGRT